MHIRSKHEKARSRQCYMDFFSVFDQNKPHRVEERGKVTLHVLQFQPIEKQLISKNF